MKLSAKIKKRLAKFSGVYTQSDAAGDEMNAILLQLTMALMMIFLIAFSLFRLKTSAELAPVAKIREEQQLNFQRQELIVALERVDEYYRIRYGLKNFANVDLNDRVVYDAAPVIENGALSGNQILRNVFINGARAAFADYSDPGKLPPAWGSRVMLEAGIDASTMQAGNRVWLDKQIDNRIVRVRDDVAALQYQAAALIQSYLALHPKNVTDEGVRSLLEQYIASPPETQRVLLNELDRSLRNYAFGFLKKQMNVSLMRELDHE